jgi:DNA (cytosine-5)-methyltransferase 1
MAMRLLDLFSGIGGFSYAAETLIGGYETVAFCEMDEFCQKVLKKHWPQVPIFDDVRTLDAARIGRIDICTFGFPCQPVSQAGLQRAESDDRWLWDEIIRILQVSKPKWIIAENVVGLITIENGLLIENCISSLEAEGYEVQSVVIPACAKNAPHRRSRIWLIGQLITNTNDTGNRTSRSNIDQEQQTIEQGWKEQSLFEFSRHDEAVANTESINRNVNEIVREHGEAKTQEILRNRDGISDTQRQNNVSNSNSQRGCSRETRRKDAKNVGERSKSQKHRSGNIEQRMGDMADGISTGLLRHFDREPEHIPRVTKGEKDRAKKLKALGNSIVPQVAAEILLAIRVSEGEENGSN